MEVKDSLWRVAKECQVPNVTGKPLALANYTSAGGCQPHTRILASSCEILTGGKSEEIMSSLSSRRRERKRILPPPASPLMGTCSTVSLLCAL